MTTLTAPTNPFASSWLQFQTATREHALAVIHDDGLYRHLRMAQPGTGVWSWEIVTWPGHLAITGDVGDGFTFARTHDMLEFFDTSEYGNCYGDNSPFINPGYWAEKLGLAQRGTERVYSPEKFLSAITQAVHDQLGAGRIEMSLDALDEFVDRARYRADDEHEARDWAERQAEILAEDFFWEADFSAFSEQYLIACYAIATTVRHYKQRTHRPGAIS